MSEIAEKNSKLATPITLSRAELDAVQYGIDLDLIEYNLRLSYDERIQQHEAALALAQELVIAREARHSRP